MHTIAGRTAVVTGSSRGIGRAIATQLAREGVRVALLARNRPALQKLAVEIGDSSVICECDVTDAQSVQSAGKTVREAFEGPPDIVVNNAGLFRVASLDVMSPDDFTSSIQTNLVAPFLILHEFLSGMRERKSGHIVTLGSVADRQIFTGNGAYAATKFGLRAMHEVLRAELRGSGVRATLVSPAAVDTEIWDAFDTESEQSRFQPRRTMLGAEAVAAAVMFAISQPDDVNVDELRLSRS